MSKELDLIMQKQWPKLDYWQRYGMVKLLQPREPYRKQWEAVCIEKQKIDFYDNDTQTVHRTKCD